MTHGFLLIAFYITFSRYKHEVIILSYSAFLCFNGEQALPQLRSFFIQTGNTWLIGQNKKRLKWHTVQNSRVIIVINPKSSTDKNLSHPTYLVSCTFSYWLFVIQFINYFCEKKKFWLFEVWQSESWSHCTYLINNIFMLYWVAGFLLAGTRCLSYWWWSFDMGMSKEPNS